MGGLLLVAVVAANVVAVMYGETIDSYLGSDRVDVSREELNAQQARDAQLAEDVESEGLVLLQNRNQTLPLSKDDTKVNVFGWASTQWVSGGSGSGGVAGESAGLLDALTAYGVSYNEELANAYRSFQGERANLSAGSLNSHDRDFCQLCEPRMDDKTVYSDQVLNDAKKYSDTAIVVLSRVAGESIDCPRAQYCVNERGGSPREVAGRQYLEPSPEEEALIRYVAANYDKVIVLVNSTNPMELGLVESIDGVDSCMLVGTTGTSAASAVVKALYGDVNPSGRTTDTYPYSFETNASWVNSGADGEGSYLNARGFYPADGTTNSNVGTSEPYDAVRYVDYAEGIYVGYRWYETADAEGYWSDVNDAYGTGYDGVVQYPFGYGLSYTSFDWKVVDRSFARGARVGADDTLSITVRVTNTGSVAGKDVVQLYYTSPYTPGGIEKSSTELCDYKKTNLLQPGASEDVTLSVRVSDMASYDCYDANHNGFCGYELEPGEYCLELKRDAHTLAPCKGARSSVRVAKGIKLQGDPASGAEVTNRFTGDASEAGISVDGRTTGANITYLSRADFKGTFPRMRVDDREMPDSLKLFNRYDSGQAYAQDRSGEGADAVDVASQGTNSLGAGACNLCENGKLTDLGRALGRDYNDERWDLVLDQLSQRDMLNLVLHGYSNSAKLDAVGKPRTKELDGSSQASSFNQLTYGVGFPNPTTLAQTWNQDLAHDFGRAVGMECAMLGIDGWYAPACNIHRSPLGGRNYEYYSEDPLLSGRMAAATIQGSDETGTFCYLKHLVLNEQDSYRDSLYTWLTEQSLRELYLEPFRIAVEEGHATGIMSSYNRIGGIWAGGSHALLTDVLRGEWGFRGSVITDYSDHHAYMNADQMLRAGGSLYMDGVFADGSFALPTNTAIFQSNLRRATKDVIYVWLNARACNLDYNDAAEQAGVATIDRPIKTRGTSPVMAAIAVLDAAAAIALCLKLRRVLRRRREAR